MREEKAGKEASTARMSTHLDQVVLLMGLGEN